MCVWSRSACLVAALSLPFSVAVAEPTTLPPPLYITFDTTHLDSEGHNAVAWALDAHLAEVD